MSSKIGVYKVFLARSGVEARFICAMARSFLNSAHTVSIGARSPLLGGKLTDTKPAFLYSLGAWMNFSLSCHIFSFLTPAPYCSKYFKVHTPLVQTKRSTAKPPKPKPVLFSESL